MQIEMSIAEAEFLKKLVGESEAWNSGARVADVLLKINEALQSEAQRLAPRPQGETPTPAEAKQFFGISDVDWGRMSETRRQAYVDEILERFPSSWRRTLARDVEA